jgi:PII-like signaling protein
MLQVYFGQDDTWEEEPLYETIVKRARELDIAGATVYRGILGYGAHKRLHRHRPLALSKDDPILVTVVDEKEKVDRLVAALDSIVSGGCLIVVSDVTVVRYEEHGKERA